jgi:hypothetical protein
MIEEHIRDERMLHIKKIKYEDIDWIHKAPERNKWISFVNRIITFWIR